VEIKWNGIMKVSQKEIYNYLISKGLSRNHALGMLANIKAESSFDPGILGDNNTSGGLFQHHDGEVKRFTKMKEFVGSDWETNWKGQIDFALQEKDGVNYKNESFNSPQEASESFTMNFEKPYSTIEKRKEEAKKRLSFFGKDFEVDKKVEFKNLQGKEISIKEVPYLINPRGKIDGKDVIIKTEDYETYVLQGDFTDTQRDKFYKDYSNNITTENYSTQDFTDDINEGKISYDFTSQYNKELTEAQIQQYGEDSAPEGPLQTIQTEQLEEESEETKIVEEKAETQELLEETKLLPSGTYTDAEGNLWRKGTEGGWQVKYNKATQEKGAPTVDEFGVPSFKMEYDYEKDWTTLDAEDPLLSDAGAFENQLSAFQGDVENLPSTITEEDKPELTNLQKAGQVGTTLLEGASKALDYIGGPGAIVSYIMGKKGLKEAMKEVQPQGSAELSPMFMQHLRQTRELAKKGFHPDQARKIRKGIDAAYQKGLDDAVRGTGGDRAKYLAQSGILDAKRSSALLNFAAKDAELQKANADKYEKIMMFKENFDITQTEKERTEDMERQLAKKKAATEFTSAAFSNVISGLGGSNSNSAIIEQMMNRYTGGTGGKGFFNQLDNK
tara:strand:- start:1917 stop:3758 length:1842 start_codon:yes stop_codon:yes gene_type:complete